MGPYHCLRNNGLGVDEWKLIGEVIKACGALEEIVDFGWSKSVLAGGVTDMDLEKKEIGDLEAVVLSSLLPRTASSLTALRLWCVLRKRVGAVKEVVCRLSVIG